MTIDKQFKQNGPNKLFASPGVRRPLTLQKIFSFETAGPNKTKLGPNQPKT